jgi:hypothetical protein
MVKSYLNFTQSEKNMLIAAIPSALNGMGKDLK